MSKLRKTNGRSSKSSIPYKVIVIGDSGVGKTNLITRFCCDTYHPSLLATIGVDFKCKEIEVCGTNINLQVWDTAGQQKYHNMTSSYYKGAHGGILVFSLTDYLSFQNIEKWAKRLENVQSQSLPKILVGCKCDQHDERRVCREDAENLANKYGIKYVEVSAKLGLNISQPFSNLGKLILQNQGTFPIEQSQAKNKTMISDIVKEKWEKFECYC